MPYKTKELRLAALEKLPCSRCRGEKENKRRVYCRKCEREMYYEQHSRRLAQAMKYREAMDKKKRVCLRCKKNTPAKKHNWCGECQAEYRTSLPCGRCGRQKENGYRTSTWCRACSLAHAKARYSSDPEKYRRQALEKIARKPDEYKSKQDIWRKENKSRVNARQNRWRSDNPDKVRWYKWARRYEEKAGGPFPSYSEISDLLDRYEWSCAYCRVKHVYERNGRLGLDHVMPVSQGGGNEVSNLVPACASCNSSKNRYTPEEWGHQIWSPKAGQPVDYNIWQATEAGPFNPPESLFTPGTLCS